MDIADLANKIKISITENWDKFAIGYNQTIIPPIRVAFEAIQNVAGSIGAYAILGGAAIGLFYHGRSLWNMKMGTFIGDQQISGEGPRSPFLQKMIRVAGLTEMAAAAILTGGLVAIGSGSTPAAIGVTGAAALLGLFA